MDNTELMAINQKLWDVVNEHVGPTDSTQLLATGGMMLKVALELYTVVLSDDDIGKLLETVKAAIPQNRAKMKSMLGERTLH